jgi:hypothetical protein
VIESTTVICYCKLIIIIKIILITLIKTKIVVIKIPLFKLTNKCSLCWFEWQNGFILQLFFQICWNQQINVHSVDSTNTNLLILELFFQIYWNQQKLLILCWFGLRFLVVKSTMSRSSKAPPCCPHLPPIPSYRRRVTLPTLHIGGPPLYSATICRRILHVAPGHSRPPVYMDEALSQTGRFIRWFHSRWTCTLSTLSRVHTPDLIDNVVYGCSVEAVKVGTTLKYGHFVG